jgi:predicted dienelactone hydrolase
MRETNRRKDPGPRLIFATALVALSCVSCSRLYAGYRWTPFATEPSGPQRAYHVWFPTDFPEKRFLYRGIFQGSVGVDAPIIEDAPKRPVVILSHGSRGSAASFAYVGEHLARHGFVCAAVDHAVQIDKGDPKQAIRARLVDVFNLYDHLQTNADRFGADLDRVVIAGFSQGGLTALLAIGAHMETDPSLLRADRTQKSFAEAMAGFEWPDKRLFPARAVLVIAPLGGGMARPFGEPIPMLVVSGDADDTIPSDTNAEPLRARFALAGWPVETVVVSGANHGSFTGACDTVIRECKETADSEAVRSRVRSAVLDFVTAHSGT